MNVKNMKILVEWTKLSIDYDHGTIAHAEIDKETGNISFWGHDGQFISHNVSKYVVPEIAYLSQFGVSITDCGNYFFVQSWEKGLFCFDLRTGTLVWHCKIKRATDLVVLKNSVICHFLEQSVCVLDLSSGEIQYRVPLGFDTHFFPLTDDYYLMGPKRHIYHLVNSSLKTIAQIPMIALNPNAYDHFIMLRADVDNGGICIFGFEHPPVVGREPPPEQCRFSRFIPVDIPGLTT